MRGLTIRLFLCVFLAVSIMMSATAFAAPTLESITFCKGVEGSDKDPVGITDKFWTYSPSVNVVAKIVTPVDGTKVTCKWISVNAGPKPGEFAEGEMTLSKKGYMNAHFELSKPANDWANGQYKVEIYIDGKKAGSASFTIL
jgi:hypothetical protein